jgi:uracil-DNA glycosylase family 4
MSNEDQVRKHPLAKCEECPLNDPRNAFVPTQFPEGGAASLAVVGEAPGFQETAYKRPFMGPSGKLLKLTLKRHAIDPKEVVLTNACLCRPQDNATPSKAAINACRPRLLKELMGAGVRDVLALGSTAAHTVLDSTSTISSLRVGAPKVPTSSLNGSMVERVVATWHPAYCLRSADAFPAFVRDVGKLRETPRVWSEPQWQAFDDMDGALAAIHELQRVADVLVVDIEVGFDKDDSFFHPNAFDLLCVGVAYGPGRAVVIGETALRAPEVRDALTALLRTKKLVAHNGKFDLAGLQPYAGQLTLWFDTMLASYCLDERPGNHGLKVLAVEELGAPKYDEEIKKYIPRGGNYANIPRPILYKYNAYDAACTWELYEIFTQRLERQHLRQLHDMLVEASDQLKFLEINGMAVDMEYNSELGNKYLKRINKLEERINAIVSAATKGQTTTLNPRSPKQIKAFFEIESINAASTNEATLKALQPRLASGSYAAQFVSTLLEHRRQQKLYSTYVVGIRKRVYRGRVYTTYLLHGTTSGRLASRNPNLQNIVRDSEIRRQFTVSKPDNILIQADYKQAELRVITDLARDEYFREILSDPQADLFTELVTQLYGISREEALDGSSSSKEKRIRVKAFVYGLGYGREVASIAVEFKIPMHEAQKLRDDFFDLIPAIAAWQNRVRETVLKHQELVTPFGRRRRFHLITDANKKDVLNEALSFLPQSTASDICLRAFTRLRPMLRGLAFVRLTIHDALTVECRDSSKDEVSQLLSEVMVEEGRRFTDYVPFAVDLSYGKSWGEL